jgi:hypothetical protein
MAIMIPVENQNVKEPYVMMNEPPMKNGGNRRSGTNLADMGGFEMEDKNLPATQTIAPEVITMGFGTKAGFELMQRAATLLAASALVPKEYQGNVSNAVIALEMAARVGASPLAVMQNLYIVHGKPSWSSQFIIAAVNGTGKFSPLRFQMDGEGDKRVCIAWATEKDTGERLESPPISMDMAKKEGWIDKNGSKWKTMPELMLRYRAATLFGRLYAPEILMGMKAYEEIIDIEGEDVAEKKKKSNAGKLTERLNGDTTDKTDEMAPAACPDHPETIYKKDYCDKCLKRLGCPVWA